MEETQINIFQKVLERLPEIIGAIIILFIAYSIGRLLSGRIQNYIENNGGDLDEQRKEMAITASRIINIVILIIGIVFALDTIGVLGNLGWLLGSLGLGIGFGLKNVLANFISGFGILMQDKTNVGDIVELGEYIGKIEEIGARTTTIRQLDGIEVIIPNSQFYEQPVKVYTANPFRRIVVNMGVGYDTDFALAEKIANEIMSSHTKIEKKPEPMFLVSSIDNSTVNIELKFWIRSNLPWWTIQSEVLKDWFVKSQEAGIDISFPVTTLRVDDRESALLADFVKSKIK